jgi:hypothetical protein
MGRGHHGRGFAGLADRGILGLPENASQAGRQASIFHRVFVSGGELIGGDGFSRRDVTAFMPFGSQVWVKHLAGD